MIEKDKIEYENLLSEELSIQQATYEDAGIISMLYDQNIEALHGSSVSIVEWEGMLSEKDIDESNFIVYQGSIPVAWLKINGLLNDDIAWISMLVVDRKYHRKGVGTYAVKYAEKFIKAKGIECICINTTDDNNSAKSLYTACDYDLFERY